MFIYVYHYRIPNLKHSTKTTFINLVGWLEAHEKATTPLFL